MNIETGEIKEFKEGEEIPKNFIPLRCLPDPTCHVCKGRGHTGKVALVRNKKKKKNKMLYGYIPCPCTNPFERRRKEEMIAMLEKSMREAKEELEKDAKGNEQNNLPA